MQILANLIVNGLAVYVTAMLLPGVNVDSFITALIVSIVLGVVNTFIKPILILVTLPVTILTLGLFTFVINALMVYLVSSLVPGFQVDSLFSALLFSLVLSLIGSFLYSLVK